MLAVFDQPNHFWVVLVRRLLEGIDIQAYSVWLGRDFFLFPSCTGNVAEFVRYLVLSATLLVLISSFCSTDIAKNIILRNFPRVFNIDCTRSQLVKRSWPGFRCCCCFFFQITFRVAIHVLATASSSVWVDRNVQLEIALFVWKVVDWVISGA